MKAKPLAYSYIRFSTPEQAAGNSYQRQQELVEGYCKRNGLTLSAATFKDLGVSAFKGKNALVGNLGEFLKAVHGGAVAPGSSLIVESLDRISRQGIDEGYDLVKKIIKSGVKLVTLSPEREFDESATKSLSKGALEIQLILERAAEESERKADRSGSNWKIKRQQARNGVLLTSRCPAWVSLNADHSGFVLDKRKAAVVRRVFALSAAGYGAPSILKTLVTEKVPPFGDRVTVTEGGVTRVKAKAGQRYGSGRWNRSYVCNLLGDRRVLGEFQPMTRRAKDGDPIPGYFPAVITETEWLKARAGAAQRRTHKGRTGKSRVNVFSGLMREARGGDPYQMTQQQSRNPGRPARQYPVLMNANCEQGVGRSYSVQYDPFESAVLSALREVNPTEIFPHNDTNSADPTTSATIELEGVAAELAEAGAYMEANGFSATIGKRVTALETRKAELVTRLADLRQLVAVPAASAWVGLKTLSAALAEADDPTDVRLRLRSALRRTVESMTLLVVPRGAIRLMAVTITFNGSDARRNILIVYKPAAKPRGVKATPARWAVRTIKHPDDGLPFSNFDLRNEHLSEIDDGVAVDGWRDVEEFLLAYPRDVIDKLLASGMAMPVAE